MNEFSTRLKKIFEYKGFKDYSEFARATGLSHQTASNYLKGERKPAIEQMKMIKQSFEDINGDWLLTGEGEMLKSIQVIHESKSEEYKFQSQDVPFYEIEGTLGAVSLFKDPKSRTPSGSIRIPNMPKCDGAIPVTGDSMYPIIKSGDIVAYKSIHNIPESIIFGQIYIVSFSLEGDEYTMVKYVKQREDKNRDFVILVSQNSHHADKEIHIRDINAMAIVKASIRFNTLT